VTRQHMHHDSHSDLGLQICYPPSAAQRLVINHGRRSACNLGGPSETSGSQKIPLVTIAVLTSLYAAAARGTAWSHTLLSRIERGAAKSSLSCTQPTRQLNHTLCKHDTPALVMVHARVTLGTLTRKKGSVCQENWARRTTPLPRQNLPEDRTLLVCTCRATSFEKGTCAAQAAAQDRAAQAAA